MSKKINSAIAAAAGTIAQNVAPVATTAIAPFQAISMNLDISLIDPSPLNPRTIFSDEGIQELSDSIQKYGLQSEILYPCWCWCETERLGSGRFCAGSFFG